MSKILPPPITTPLIADKEGYPDIPWINFFNQIFTGDTGTSWTPTFTSLGSTGTPTITGVYYKIGPLCYFNVTITPATDTTSTAGVTYCDLPLTARGNGPVFALSGNAGGIGMINASQGRAYPPAWSAVTVPVTLIGVYET